MTLKTIRNALIGILFVCFIVWAILRAFQATEPVVEPAAEVEAK